MDLLSKEIQSTSVLKIFRPEDYEEWAVNPIKWSYDILELEDGLEDFQKKALSALVRERFVCISAGSGVGKSALMAIAGLWFVTTHPLSIVCCTAPSAVQLYAILWREFRKWMRKSRGGVLERVLTYYKTKIEINDDKYRDEWYIVSKTAKLDDEGKVSEGLAGFHANWIFYIVDEASGVDDRVFGAIEGSLSTRNSFMLMCSNYTRTVGYFHNAMTNDSTWYRMRVSCFESKFVDPKYIKRMKDRFGEDSDVYRIKVLGLPPRSGSLEGIFTEEELRSLSSPLSEVFEGVSDEVEPKAIYVGVDVARYGNDLTVMWARRGYTVFDVRYEGKLDAEECGEFIWKALVTYSVQYPDYPVITFIDATGYGAGVYDILKRKVKSSKRNITIYPVESSRRAKDQMFYNLRSETFFKAKELMKKLKFTVSHPRLESDLRAITYSFKDGKILLVDKETIKSKTGVSPDFADAFALCCLSEPPGGKIPKLRSVSILLPESFKEFKEKESIKDYTSLYEEGSFTVRTFTGKIKPNILSTTRWDH